VGEKEKRKDEILALSFPICYGVLWVLGECNRDIKNFRGAGNVTFLNAFSLGVVQVSLSLSLSLSLYCLLYKSDAAAE